MAVTTKLLKQFFKPNFNQVRTLIKNKVTQGGIEYYGFKYHPRHPDFKDPPYEPSKLFLVTRIKPIKGTNPVERANLEKLNIDGDKRYYGHMAIIKNIPEMNASLWKIKHLVSIVPITCPYGLPQDGDYTGTYLYSSGKFVVSHRLKVPEENVAAAVEFEKNGKRISGELKKKHLRQRWDYPYGGTINERP